MVTSVIAIYEILSTSQRISINKQATLSSYLTLYFALIQFHGQLDAELVQKLVFRFSLA